MKKEPQVTIGILSCPALEFVLSGSYLLSGSGAPVAGKQSVSFRDGKISWNGELYDELLFEPADYLASTFDLLEVVIGIHFHWERKEDQRFQGALRIIAEGEQLTAINIIPVEDYLTSVISSEMSATASLELLKAHAVISRSWLLAQIQKNKKIKQQSTVYTQTFHNEEELIRWYDREDHDRFDVCADDHCQRYQGITRASTEQVKQAIAATRGEVLLSGGEICDARFSKCCGGVFEEFQYCWEDIKYPYLSAQRDSQTETVLPDLQIEEKAEQWIRSTPESFCNTNNKETLSQVLNNYDQETTHFYRWRVEYTQEELAALIRERSGMDYGEIIDLIPIARGTSARLFKLKIVGTRRTLIIGKELEIRRTLSPSHLYSSAFVVDKEGETGGGLPAKFILTGAGWGHGVGLCQIGAAVMGEQGAAYDTILYHYYPGAAIQQMYP
jgi:SpoIID/LytB domain protein